MYLSKKVIKLYEIFNQHDFCNLFCQKSYSLAPYDILAFSTRFVHQFEAKNDVELT